MSTRKTVLTFLSTLLALVALGTAQAQTAQATVAQITGTASVTLPDGSSHAVTEGMKLPQGAQLTTGNDSQVIVNVHEGIVAVASSETTIAIDELSVSANGMRNATIALKSGNLASSLDPSQKAINNYKVSTPKGIAMARGTTYSVRYNGGLLSVTVVAGVVQSFNLNGVSLGTTTAGNVSNTSDAGTTSQTLAQAIATEGAALSEALTILASSVAYSSNNTPATVSAVLTTIATAAGTSEAATAIVAQATASAAYWVAETRGVDAAASVVAAAVTASAKAGNVGAAGAIVATATTFTAQRNPGNVGSIATSFTAAATAAASAAGTPVSVNAADVATVSAAALSSGAVKFLGTTVLITTEVPAPTNQNILQSLAYAFTTPQPIDPATISRSE